MAKVTIEISEDDKVWLTEQAQGYNISLRDRIQVIVNDWIILEKQELQDCGLL